MFETVGWATLSLFGSQFFIVLARLSLVVFLIPGIGEQVVPVRVRVLVLLSLSLAFTSMGIVAPVPIIPLAGFLSIIVGEIAIGFCLGVSLRLCIWILSAVGSIVAQSIGLAQFLGVGLETEAQTITSNLLGMAGAALLLTANYHVSAFEGVLRLYGQVPMGGYGLIELSGLIKAFFAAFNFALNLAWPFVTVSLVYNISLGFINKAMPQLMVAFVGAPFMVGAGLFILTVSVTSMLLVWKDRLPDFVPWM